jgi:predicted Na+-dependent transporter
VFASLTPVAIVAPFFTNVIDGDEEFSFLLLVASMILCPIITPFLLKILVGSLIPINTWPLFKNMLLLITLPLLISFLVATFLPRVRQKFAAHLSILNMGSLSILIFILWGTAIGRLNLSYTTAFDVSKILLLVFIQDFGVLFVSRFILFRIYDQRTANALVVSLSMKNVAIAAGILLFYDPKASFPAALAFIAHAFLFNFIPLFKRIFIPAQIRRQA